MKIKGNLQVSGTTEGITFTDGTTTFARNSQLTFGSDFYLAGDSTGHPKLQLRNPPTALAITASQFYLGDGGRLTLVNNYDYASMELEVGSVSNTYVIPDAPYGMAIDRIFTIAKSGTGTMGFYIIAAAALNKNGVAVTGADPISLSSTAQTIFPTGNQALTDGDSLLVSVYSNTSMKNLRVGIRLRRT